MEAICKRAVALGKADDDEMDAQIESTAQKFLSLEDEEELNDELKQFASKKRATRA